MKFVLISAFFFFAEAVCAESQIDQLTKRIQLIENTQQELILQTSEENSKVNSFLRSNFTLGGFFEPSYTLIQGPDTSFKAASSANTLGLNFAAEYSNRLRFVGQVLTGLFFPIQNPHNDPRHPTYSQRTFGAPFYGALLTQGYLDYEMRNGWSLSGGQGYAPFGYAAQQRELVLFIRRGGPQILRTSELFSPLWSGFHLHKTSDYGSYRLGFNAYSFTRFENANTPGLGARVWWENTGGKILTGLSFQTAKFNSNMDHIVGYDVRLQNEDFLLTAEYAIHLRPESNPWSFYIEPSVFVFKEEVLLYTSLDFAQSSLNKTTPALPDPYQKYEYGFGVNWLPTSYTRLRLGAAVNDYVYGNAVVSGKNRDCVTLDISAGVAF